MLVAIALFIASIAASFLIAFTSHQGSSYWVMRSPLPAGARIAAEDVLVSKVTIGRAITGYLPSTLSPIGSITKRSLAQGEILHQGALSKSSKALTSESISLPIRATDFPPTVKPGDFVSIYQLHDVRNGESAIAPQLIISPAFVEGVTGKDRNFSGDLSITVSISRADVPKLLAATTSGRLVVIAIRG